MLINSLTEPIKYTSPNLPENNVNHQRRVPKMQGKLLDFGMRKHLVEEIATSEKVQTKQPVCLCGRFLAGEQPRSMESLECPPWFAFVAVIRRGRNKDFPIYSRATESKSARVMKRHSLPLWRLLKRTQTVVYQRAVTKRIFAGWKINDVFPLNPPSHIIIFFWIGHTSSEQ